MTQRVYVRKKCPHTKAVMENNGDWEWLVCKACGEKLNEDHYAAEKDRD